MHLSLTILIGFYKDEILPDIKANFMVKMLNKVPSRLLKTGTKKRNFFALWPLFSESEFNSPVELLLNVYALFRFLSYYD